MARWGMHSPCTGNIRGTLTSTSPRGMVPLGLHATAFTAPKPPRCSGAESRRHEVFPAQMVIEVYAGTRSSDATRPFRFVFGVAVEATKVMPDSTARAAIGADHRANAPSEFSRRINIGLAPPGVPHILAGR
jgi:hypothetical protein